MMATLVEGVKTGSKVLVHNGHKYQKNKTRNEKIFWRCWRKDCRAPIQTNIFDFNAHNPAIAIQNEGQHNHPPVSNIINSTAVKYLVINEIKRYVTKPVKRVYDEIIEQQRDINVEDVPRFDSVRSQFTRVRSSLIPHIPENVEQVMIPDEYQNSWSDEQFLSFQDNDWGILIYATRDNYANLRRCRTVYIDGTFKTTPHPYTQFATIHGNYHGFVLPFVMCLLDGKTVGKYRQLLQHVKHMVRRVTGHRWSPQRIVSDFELSLLLAIETELPQVRKCGCYFHFCQSLWRRIQELGLTRSSKGIPMVKDFLQKLMALGYLPLLLVRQNFFLFIDQTVLIV